jgi:hypothetical protein
MPWAHVRRSCLFVLRWIENRVDLGKHVDQPVSAAADLFVSASGQHLAIPQGSRAI